MFKKLLISFLVSLTLLFSFAPYAKVSAQNSWYNQSPAEWYLKVYDESASPSNEIFGERYTAAQVQWVIYSVIFTPVNIIYGILGMSPTPSVCFANLVVNKTFDAGCLSDIPAFLGEIADKLKLPSVQTIAPNNSNLAVKRGSSYIWRDVFLTDRPLSGISYVRNIIRKLNPVQDVNAASTTSYGFSRLAPIQPLWKLSRNIAYFFFILITLVAAFMIMFKVKISPQAVVTVQSAIPKIVITLILVTFSYAIAGFMVDLVYVVMGIFSQFFTPVITNYGSTTATYQFLNGWLGDGFLSILLYSFLYWILSMVFSLIIAIVSITTGGVASLIFGIFLLIFFLINVIILIVYIFVGIFNLFKALAQFYIAVIFGPLQLALGALPSSKGTFGNWLKSLIGKLAVFPAQGILWYFGFLFLFGALNASLKCTTLDIPSDTIQKILNGAGTIFTNTGAPQGLIDQFTHWAPTGNCWGPPLLGNAAGATAIAFLLMSASCILMLGKVQKAIEAALKGREFDYETAITQPVKQTVSTAGGVLESVNRAQKNPSGAAAAISAILQALGR